MMPPTKSQSGKRMWPFSDMPLSTATWWSDVANLVLLLSLIFGVLSTFAIVRLANVKEHHWDMAREQSRERVAELETQLGNAQAAIADANARALEAQLALEKFKAPRKLSAEQQSHISQMLREFTGIKFDVATNSGDPEAGTLLPVLENVLVGAGWEQMDWAGGDIVFSRTGRKVVGIVSLVGVVIQMDPSKVATFSAPASKLADLLRDAGIDAKAEGGSGTQAANNDAMHVLIGKKP